MAGLRQVAATGVLASISMGGAWPEVSRHQDYPAEGNSPPETHPNNEPGAAERVARVYFVIRISG